MELEGKLKKAREHLGKNQKEMAALVGSGYRSWQGYEQGQSIPGGQVFKALTDLGFNASWFFSDDAPMLLKDKQPQTQAIDDMTSMEAAAQVSPDSINIQQLINMTAEVLVSNTVYRPALAANIKAFHRSISLEQDNQELRHRIEKLETDHSLNDKRFAALEQELSDLRRDRASNGKVAANDK